jgi:hypothetical protein
MTRYDLPEDDDDEDEESVARNQRVNATALRCTCTFIRQETCKTYHTASTIKIREIDQNALLGKYLELPVIRHAMTFWFKMSMEDVDRIIDTPHLSDIITQKLPILQRLQCLACISVCFPKIHTWHFATPGAPFWGLEYEEALERMQEAFDKGRVGKPVEFVDAARRPALAYGAP